MSKSAAAGECDGHLHRAYANLPIVLQELGFALDCAREHELPKQDEIAEIRGAIESYTHRILELSNERA